MKALFTWNCCSSQPLENKKFDLNFEDENNSDDI